MGAESLKLLFVGNRGHSKQILSHLLKEGWDVVCAIGAAGEVAHSQSDYRSFNDLCENNGVAFKDTADINEDSTLSFVDDHDPDFGVCAGWTQIIKEEFLNQPPLGIGGFHASPLPEGRGGAPVNWQIIHDCDTVGVSLFRMVPELDHGELLGQDFARIEDRDDVATMYNKVTHSSCDILDHVLPALEEGTLETDEQDYASATYYPQRTPDDGLVDWSWDAKLVNNWIRAQTHPYPGAFTFYEGDRLFLWKADQVDLVTDSHVPGEVIQIEDGDGIIVSTGDGAVRIDRVQHGDGAPAWADMFAVRNGLSSGTVLGEDDDFPDWLYTGLRDESGGFRYQTNLEVGESGTVRAVCCSQKHPREVGITATLNGSAIVEEQTHVDGWTSVPIQFSPSQSGPHTLKVTFVEDDDLIDTRYIKIYAHKS